jgi:hypothetical protein
MKNFEIIESDDGKFCVAVHDYDPEFELDPAASIAIFDTLVEAQTFIELEAERDQNGDENLPTALPTDN